MSSSVARYLPRALGDAAHSSQDDQSHCGREGRSQGEAGHHQHTLDRRDAPDLSAELYAHSDEALLALVGNGDTEALASLFRRYARVVRGVACRVVRDVSEADDLLQDIFLLIHRLCGTFDSSKGPARSWILQMTYRRAISRRRYLTSRHFYTRVDLDDVGAELADPRSSAADIEDVIDATRGNGNLQKVFEELSGNQQETLRLFFGEGYTFDEIAEKLGQSRGNIKNHYFRGLDRLRKHIFSGKLAGPGAL